MTTSPTTGPETEFVTVLTMFDVGAPPARRVFGVAVVEIVLRTLVWVMVVEPVLPSEASVAVMVQVPVTAEAWYVTLALPAPLVFVGLAVMKVPQLVPPLVVKFTESFGTGPPPEPLTVAVTTDRPAAETLSAGTLLGLAATATVLAAVLVWVIVIGPPLPPEPSAAETEQKPVDVDAV